MNNANPNNDSWSKVSVEANLISLPDIYWRLKELLDSHNYALPDVAELIVYDPGLTARILRLVNSAYFGFAANIETVNHAVSVLGVRQIEDLVLTTSIADALGDYQCEHLDVKKFWLDSVYRAIAGRNLAGICNLMDGERMFVAGLLSGIGHLVMYQSVPVLTQQAHRQARDSGKSLYLFEREIIGFDHAQVAAVLMQNWKLPQALVTIIDNHMQLDPQADYLLEASIVHLSTLIGNAFSDHLQLDEVLVDANSLAWDTTGLDIGQCEAIDAGVAEQLNGVVNMLFPKLRPLPV